MKRLILIIVVLALAAGAIYFYRTTKTDPATNEDIIKIGVILPLSGNNAIIGTQLKEGLDLITATQNYDKSFMFIFEDDQMQAARTSAIANKFANIDKVDAIITYASQPAAIVAPIATEHGIIQFANASDVTFTKYDGNYAFAPSPEHEMRTLLNAIKKRGYQKIALITANEAYSNLAESNVKKLTPQMDLEIVYQAKVNPSDRDFKMLISKAETTKPDIYIIQTWEPVLDILVTQLKQVAPEKPFTAAYAFFLSMNPELFEGQFCLNIGSNNEDYQKLFYQHYQKNPEQMSAVGFAETDLMLKAMSKMKNWNEFYDELKKAAQEESILGSLTINGQQINYQPIIQEFRNGKPVTLPQ